MRRILIIEDNNKKLEKIRSFLETEFPEIRLVEKTSYNSASKEVSLHYSNYNLILLDMSMQTYDISNDESGGEPEPLAGKNILKQMYLRAIPTKVLVLTMYENYVDGTRIKELDEELRREYKENYIGYVFFSHKNLDWSKELKTVINNNV